MHFHLAGGTPTMLAPDDLRRLGGWLHERLAIAADAEISRSIRARLSGATVDALAAIWVNRASLGVQDVNPEVQRDNRRQPFAVVNVRWTG